MLLTAMYSEDEADVTAVQILESAFPFRREPGGRDSSKEEALRQCTYP